MNVAAVAVQAPRGRVFAPVLWGRALACAVVVLSLLTDWLPASAQSLPELYAQTLALDPAVGGAEAQLHAAEQRQVQARAGFGPTVAMVGNYSETRYREAPQHEQRKFQGKQLNLQITQPLLRSALVPALDAAEAQLYQAQAGLDQARADSAQRMVEACFEVLKARDALDLARAQRVSMALLAVLGILLLWPVSDRVTAHTVIEGRTRQVVTAPFEGFIAQVLVRPGEQVSKGQLLARLDDRELKLEQGKYRSERNQAAGKLRQAMAEHDAAAMALAQADVQQAEAQLALVESKLLRAGLVAPMDGLVVTGDWAQQIGGPVEVGKEMFEIATTGGYRVVLHVPDRDIARVKPGQSGILRLTGQPQTTYDFEVTRVTATAKVEEGINGFRVEAEWRGAVPALSPGMQGVGKVEVGRASLLTVWTRSSVDWLRLKLWGWWW